MKTLIKKAELLSLREAEQMTRSFLQGILRFAIYRVELINPSSMMTLLRSVLLLFVLGMPFPTACSTEAADPVKYLTESEFEAAIQRPLQVNGDAAQLRNYLQRLSQVKQVAILLDRRIDPSQRIEINIAAEGFTNGIQQLVAPVGCDTSVVADTIIVGPTESVRFLRTRLEFARDELDEEVELSPKQQFNLLRRYPLTWERLTTPREILQLISDRYHIGIENLNEVPHDLWSAGTIAYPNFVEGMLIVLAQYELSFAWLDENHIRIVPEIPDVGINQGHKPKGMSLKEALALVKQKFPNLVMRPYQGTVLFTGTVEEHEEVAYLVGEKLRPKVKESHQPSAKLRDLRFTFRMVDKPFGSLMATLQQQGVDVRYDAEQINAANINLATEMSLELNEATIDQLLEKSCEKVGLTYRIEGDVVFLIPD